tara:strand:- start:133 stop:378 length:246 start_codon:yes stop_codon:yes gene_type:complete
MRGDEEGSWGKLVRRHEKGEGKWKERDIPSADPLSSSLSSCRASSSLDKPDMKSSSESIVSGVGGDIAAAEAVFLVAFFAG